LSCTSCTAAVAKRFGPNDVLGIAKNAQKKETHEQQ